MPALGPPSARWQRPHRPPCAGNAPTPPSARWQRLLGPPSKASFWFTSKRNEDSCFVAQFVICSASAATLCVLGGRHERACCVFLDIHLDLGWSVSALPAATTERGRVCPPPDSLTRAPELPLGRCLQAVYLYWTTHCHCDTTQCRNENCTILVQGLDVLIRTVRNPSSGFPDSKDSLLKRSEFQCLDFL